MGNRGFTLVELLVALVAATGLLLGIGGLYVYSQRVASGSESQTFLQRQGAIVMDQMAQQIRPASTMTTGCSGSGSLGVTRPKNANTDPAGWADPVSFCFYTSGTQLKMDTPGGTWNVLSNTATVLSVTAFTTTLSDPSVTISFQLSDQGIRGNSMTFVTNLTRRN